MPGVIADTGPLNYLILIGEIGLLPRLFGSVSIPDEVRLEMLDPRAPQAVRDWMTEPPAWLHVAVGPFEPVPSLEALDAGERATISLALERSCELVVMDERAGVRAARALGLRATGTLGLLELGARRGWVDIHNAVARLRATSFRVRPALLNELLDRHRNATGNGR